MENLTATFIFVFAALLEVGGDALIRKGLRGLGAGFIILGMVALGLYGIVVNTVRWDFSKMLGVYIALFALVSTAFGVFVFKETIPGSRWIGMALIVVGGLVIQFVKK